MVVIAAARVKPLAASWAAGFALHVLMDGQLRAARAAKDCFLRPLALGPDFDWVAGERFVAIFASVVHAAALHLDRDDVGGAVIVLAAGLRIEIDSAHIQWFRKHGAPGEIAYSIEPRRARHSAVNVGHIDQPQIQKSRRGRRRYENRGKPGTTFFSIPRSCSSGL